jgi:hypothetical protein
VESGVSHDSWQCFMILPFKDVIIFPFSAKFTLILQDEYYTSYKIMADPLATIATAIEVVGRIVAGVQGWRTREADQRKYRRAMSSILAVLEAADNNHSLIDGDAINSISESLIELESDFNRVMGMNPFVYMCQARQCQSRLHQDLMLVEVQVGAYHAQMTARLGGDNGDLIRRQTELLIRIQDLLNEVLGRGEAPNDQLVVVGGPPPPFFQIIPHPDQFPTAWATVTKEEKDEIQGCIDQLLPPAEPIVQPPRRRCRNPMVLLGIFAVVGLVAAAISLGTLYGTTTEAPHDSSHTLSAIISRDYLRCGVTIKEGYATLTDQGHLEGFEVDLCRAVAAAIFGSKRFQAGRDSEPVEFVQVEATDRFSVLDNNEIDLLLGITSQTVERSVFEVSTGCVGFMQFFSLVFALRFPPNIQSRCSQLPQRGTLSLHPI